MTDQEVINFLDQARKILLDDKSWLESVAQQINEAFDMAISALQAQDSKTRRICDTCKHDPPSKKWPCVDCDMRDPADRWEAQDAPDTNVGDMISRQAAIDTIDKALSRTFAEPCGEMILKDVPSEQSKKLSEVLQNMMDEDYYLFCHTGYSRLAEKDWEWLIKQVNEMEQKGRTDGDGRD